MAEIIKVYKEHLPALRFVGKKYTEADRADGSFGHKWGEWFENNWFKPLEALGGTKCKKCKLCGKCTNTENGYLGFMRGNPHFEYWIGVFLPPKTEVPNGYDYIDLDESDVGTCWIKGKEDGGIYAMHEQCFEKLMENGMKQDKSEKAFAFERYNCPRFTEKDKQGNVILDYCISVES